MRFFKHSGNPVYKAGGNNRREAVTLKRSEKRTCFCWGVSLPHGLDFIAVYSSWAWGTASHLNKDGCGQKPNSRAFVLPVCLTCVPITLVIHEGSVRGCIWNGRQQLLTEIDHASLSCWEVMFLLHYSVADNHAGYGFSSPSETAVSWGWVVLQKLLGHETTLGLDALYSAFL